MEDEYLGAVKIMDGLFLGDKEASQDVEFLTSSKVTHILNCASEEVKNEWASIGIIYLSLPLKDSETETIFQEPFESFFSSFDFIETCLDSGESILVHSVKGESRSVTFILAFLMNKFKWSLTKCLEFLNTRKPDCKIKANFILQLVKLENFLAKANGFSFSKNWDSALNADEELLRNTFLNSKPGEFVKYEGKAKRRKRTIRWIDGFVENKRIQSASGKRIFRNSPATQKAENESRKSDLKKTLKSCLKISPVLENSARSLNNLVLKNLSERVESSEDLKVKRISRNSSVSKRENSSILKDLKKSRPKLKKKSFPLLSLLDIKKVLKKH
jgi:protein-tyrosine phosphatase